MQRPPLQRGAEGGHWQRGTHCSVHIGAWSPQVRTQALPHRLNTCPPVHVAGLEPGLRSALFAPPLALTVGTGALGAAAAAPPLAAGALDALCACACARAAWATAAGSVTLNRDAMDISSCASLPLLEASNWSTYGTLPGANRVSSRVSIAL